MNELLKGYVSVSISAALLTIVLLMLRPLYKNRFSKRWQYYIWLVVIVRLLVPWNPQNGLVGNGFCMVQEKIQSVAEKMEAEKTEAQKMEAEKMQTDADSIETESIETESMKPDEIKAESIENTGAAKVNSNMEPDAEKQGMPSENQTETGMEKQGMSSEKQTDREIRNADDADTEAASDRKIWQMLQNLWILWLVPALMMWVRKITIYQCFVRFLKAGSVPVDEISRLEILGHVIDQHRIHGKMELYQNSLTASPLLTGFFHPAIILTKAEISDTDFYYIVLHETTHYRRRDMFYKWLVQFTVCLHWFNPLVYVLARETDRLCELSCDEAVTKKLDPDEKRAYGDTLLRAMGAGGCYNNPPVSVSLYEGKELLKERLGAIMRKNQKTGLTAVLSAIAAVLLMTGAMAAGAYVQPQAAEQVKKEIRLTDDKIIEKNGMFYILCEGASEQDIPSGGVTKGCIGITLVKKDGYTATGPFHKIATLSRDVKAQINDMMAKKNIAKEEAQLLAMAAETIQKDLLKVKISKTSVSLAKGSTMTLKLQGTDQQAVWTSGSKEVATVSKNGKVTAKKAGKAVITASLYGQTYTCAVKVSAQSENAKTVQKGIEQEVYRTLGIIKKNGAWFYQGERVRIFMALRTDQSFSDFHYDENGTIDLRVDHAEDKKKVSVRHLTKAEVKEIQNDRKDTTAADRAADRKAIRQELERQEKMIEKKREKDQEPSVYSLLRLQKEELPQVVQETIQRCKDQTWYVIADGSIRYVYYQSLPGQYAFESESDGQKLKIRIADMKSSAGTYVLLAVKSSVPFRITYRNQEVVPHKISTET